MYICPLHRKAQALEFIQGEIEQPGIKYCLNKEKWEIGQKLFKKMLQI
ncbi:hypothetical protein ES705_33606 [subsurface metagenome]